jgi:hypothetical protein
MPDAAMHGIDDGLAVRAQVVDVAVVEVEDPGQRLRGGVMSSPSEQKTMIGDWMLRRSTRVPSEGAARPRQPVADEQLVDDELHLLGVQRDMPAPPFLEAEVAFRLAVDIGPDLVLLGPVGVGGVAGSRSSAPARRRRTCRRRGRPSSPSARPPSSPPR